MQNVNNFDDLFNKLAYEISNEPAPFEVQSDFLVDLLESNPSQDNSVLNEISGLDSEVSMLDPNIDTGHILDGILNATPISKDVPVVLEELCASEVKEEVSSEVKQEVVEEMEEDGSDPDWKISSTSRKKKVTKPLKRLETSKPQKSKKLYEQKPFDDPVKEKNRQNAINAKKNRDRKKKEKVALMSQMDILREENEKLRAENKNLRKLLKRKT